MNKSRGSFGNWMALQLEKSNGGYSRMIGTNTCDTADDSLKHEEKKMLFAGFRISDMSLSLSTGYKCVCVCVCCSAAPLRCCVCDVISWAASAVCLRGKKNNLLLLVIFSFFPQQVGNKPTFSVSIFSTSSCKMKPEIVPPPLLPFSLCRL